MMDERVILVDAMDTPVGTADKLEAHRSGRLHRAFSVFVLNDGNELLLQRRAEGKYHSGGLWSNTCCSHPRPGEDTAAAAGRRLEEEMGFRCDLVPAFDMVYRADVGNGLVEYEYDHIFLGRWNGSPSPDAREVMDWRWVALDDLAEEVVSNPRRFTYWFRVALLELDARGLLPFGVHRVA
jgi:isopentenyl-diphosphate delta-isomerase